MPFKPGQSGNKKGRPPGSKNAKTLAKEALEGKAYDTIMGNIEGVIKVVVDQALQGCTKSQKMLLDRVVATRKAVEHTGDKNKQTAVHVNILPAPPQQNPKAIQGETVEVIPNNRITSQGESNDQEQG